jgi:Resolvase, N terminal domain/Tn3 transposase DDE domain
MTSRRASLNATSVKAALYARVSTDDGRQTVANQVRQLRELAVSRDFEIFREYTDEETGASASRASFLALLRDARLRRFRVLLITDLDRLTREGAAAGFAHLADHLVANLLIFHNVVTMSKALERLIAEGCAVDVDLIACSSPYLTGHLNRFGRYELNRERVSEPLECIREFRMPPLGETNSRPAQVAV